MTDKQARMEALKGFVMNRVNCDKQQLMNTIDTINDYLDKMENLLIKIKEDDVRRFDNLRQINELASRLRVLYELKIKYDTDVSLDIHTQKELESLGDDTK